MSAIKAYARKLEWQRIMQEQLAQPRRVRTSSPTMRALERSLGQRAARPPSAPAVPTPALAAPASEPTVPALEAQPTFGRGPGATAPSPTPTSPPVPTVPEVELNFVRGRDGKIERAVSERHVVNFKRDIDGKISGARIQLKEPK